MPNIEIKASYPNLDRGREIAERYKTKSLGVLRQIDTYFNTPNGRLKLREIPGQGSWLIPYSKTYEKSPSKSDYQLLEAKDPEGVKKLFSTLLGTQFVVDKTREVFLIDNVRIHLDQVVGLGNFVEFEAVFEMDTIEVRERETRKVRELMQVFGIRDADVLTCGYVDLLETAKSGESWTRGGYQVSTDVSLLDLNLIHLELSKSYWAEGIPRDLVEESFKNSLCFGVYDLQSGSQVGWARVVSDFSTFAYLADVFVLPDHRGRGISKFLMDCVMAHPRLQGLRRFCLGTRDAHSLYQKYGFKVIEQPESWMEIKVPGIYRRMANGETP